MEATTVREKEAADFALLEAELVDNVGTLERAVAILGRAIAEAPRSFVQIDTCNMRLLDQALGSVLDADDIGAIEDAEVDAALADADEVLLLCHG